MADTDDTRRMIHNGQRTKPGVWRKLPTGELKIKHKFDQAIYENMTGGATF